MPVSDIESYPEGHFQRVFRHLIAPACEQAGFVPVLASEVKETNFIVLDILERLYTAEMVLCDLSTRNPNVLFELGFRQAFNKPVTLIKDTRTERIFDISGLRDIPYDESLRVDTTQETIGEIAERLKATLASSVAGGGSVNSLVQLLRITPAATPQGSALSPDTHIVLDAIGDISDRLAEVEARVMRPLGGGLWPRPGMREMRLEVRGNSDSIERFIERLRCLRFVEDVRGPGAAESDAIEITVEIDSSSEPQRAQTHVRSIAEELDVTIVSGLL
jgi:hypothetical protein